MPRCAKCEKKLKPEHTYNWLDGLDTLSPSYCYRCYLAIIDAYEEGDDIEDYVKDD